MSNKNKFKADDLKWCIEMASNYRQIANYILSLEINNKILQSRIDKAIEYIENECLDDDYNYCWDLCGNDIFEVLDILKGSDSNEE